jgi:hypothetical protein
VSLILDAGALVALERGDLSMWRRYRSAFHSGDFPLTHGGVIGQVWRRSARQALLAKALQGIEVRALDDALGRAAGALLASTGTADVIDAALVLLATDGDVIVTSDSDDIERLASAAGLGVEIVHV